VTYGMPIAIPGRVVVFDYGEVISVPSETVRAELLEIAGGEPLAFWNAYWGHRDALDAGALTAPAYWRCIQHELGQDWDPVMIYRLGLADYRGWIAVEPDTLDVLVDLHQGQTRMALLSNAGPEYVSYFRFGPLGEFFEEVFVSGELGITKPATAIFNLLLAGLRMKAQDVVFIDNNEHNIRAAHALGISTHHFTTPKVLRSYLEDLAPPV
jgi:putative hydrolase of the HAD superfamily